MTKQVTEEKTIPCRYCRQPVHPKATKCQHCGEQLTQRSRIGRATKNIVGSIGIFTALLSVFYAAKEGYFYIEQRQQQREMFSAHMNAADHFLKLDNLDYAEASLNQALELNPNDMRLQLRLFLLRSRNILREVDYYGAQLPDEHLAVVPELITSGFSLVENDFSPNDRAMLFTSLARLLQYDRRWQNPDAIEELFKKARKLSPSNAEIAYWYGEWLINQEPPSADGFSLIQQAASNEPDNALYSYALGLYQSRQGDYASAFTTLRHTIELRPKQQELQRIRASNEAKGSLRRALLKADEKSDITGPDFFNLDMDERLSLMEFALEHGGSNRRLRLLAARLFHNAGRNDQAEPWVRKVLGDYDERSDTKTLQLLSAILEAQNKEEEAQQIREIVARKEERATFEEILETGYEDKHRYKVGLRVAKQNEGDGIEVLKAFEGYPFAKAGVQQGDRILEFAHRRITNLRSIWVPINDFTPGTDVPLKISRGDEVISLTVVIE